MGKNSGNHVKKDNTICDIRVRHSGGEGTGTRRLRGREMGLNACRSPKRGGEGGSSGISSDGVDRRIFLGLKFSIPGFSWVGKFGKYFFFEGKKITSILAGDSSYRYQG